MEVEFGKHFKDATNLLLMMDHDSGYVEGGESYTLSSNESDSLKETMGMTAYSEPENFLLSEDALLEKPELYLNLGNLTQQIESEDYEETRRLFFSPEVIHSSVKSENSSIIYSGLESESSGEIPLQSKIIVDMADSCTKVHDDMQALDLSVTSTSDMSLEVSTFEPVIIEKNKEVNSNCVVMSPVNSFSSSNKDHLKESTISYEHSNIINKTYGQVPSSEKKITDNNFPIHESASKTVSSFQETLSKTGCSSTHEIKNVLDATTPNIQENLTTIKSNLGKPNVESLYDSPIPKGTKINALTTSKTPSLKSGQDISFSIETKIGDLSRLGTPSVEPQCCSPASKEIKTSHITDTENIRKSVTPSKINPLTTVTNTFDCSKEKRRLTLVFSKTEKENGYCVKRKYPSMTPEKKVTNPIDCNVSPDIFGDDVLDDKPRYFEIQSKDNLLPPLTQQIEEKYVDKLDQKLLKRTQKGLSGVLPPPSLTVIHMSAVDILAKLEENKKYFWNNDDAISDKVDNEEVKNISLNSSTESNSFSKSFLVNVDLEKAKVCEWPEVLNMRYHGLHHNCNKISEEIVDLCDKYQKRFVGAESQSTCTVFETQNLSSPSKRKMAKPRWGGKSPGRRLSHLARRRITFSSANLQAGGSSLAGSRARQILVDAKKIELLNRRKSPRKSPRKTPRKTPKKTPSKSPKVKTRTPSSSAKKKLAMRFRKLTGEFEKSLPSTSEMSSTQRALFNSPDRSEKKENSNGITKSTKRALFQSPNRDTRSSLFTSKSQDLSTSGDKSQLRRALFTSPRKMSPLKGKKSPYNALKFGFDKKRKRSESDDMRPSKFSRSMSMDIRPSSSGINKSICRTQSELNISLNRSQSQLELSDQHKKKLHWAVYGALQSQNITNSHPQWKSFASVLGRVTCRIFTSQMAARGGANAKIEGGTTERMNRIARRHVISVIKGKTVEEIISDYIKSSRPKVLKPQGYVAPEDFNNTKNKILSASKDNVFQDRGNTIESWEKKKLELVSKPAADSKIERIRKVINFGDDR